MAYTSLYRKYRPDSFDKMLGQKHVVKTLSNAVLGGKISHAYLFTGTRGTGKTTTAKIFARAINCEKPLADGSPCGVCEVCKALASANNMDILEMDAASNNSVDDIRDLIEKVKYVPVSCKYKVYIIDEVHMLTMQAFNALLKTLEEPPAHTVFILATTEVHKLPQTILSRCMRFDFRLLSTAELSTYLTKILDKEGREYQIEAVRAIAEAGDGSVRDMLSVADMCLSYTNDRLTYDDVLEVLGASSPKTVVELCSAIISHDPKSALEVTDKILSLGKSVGLLARDVAKTMRSMLYILNCSNANRFLSLPKDLFEALSELADKTDNDALVRIIEIFVNIENQLRASSSPTVTFETCVVKACDLTIDLDQDAVLRRLKDVEAKVRTIASHFGDIDENLKLDLGEVWGYLLNTVRASSTSQQAYACAAAIATSDLSFADGALTINVDNEKSLPAIKQYLQLFENTVKKRYFEITALKINYFNKEEALNKDIKTVQNLFDEDMVNVTDSSGKSNIK
ncbi:MAG: DNA polymerase III subunit gamma/tau [Clostridia bacterium]|nr:DNA polymerase III subunit gamma/tau [Clostridia bacterium]